MAMPATGRARTRRGLASLPTVAERAARGLEARSICPRSAHGAWEPPAEREGAVEMLEAQASSRLAELVPIRYGRMVESPFAFFRGAAAMMAADLADVPRTGIDTQLCGDAHLSNFGTFAAPDRRMVFSILVASFAVAGRERGLSASQRRAAQLTAARTYRDAMQSFARMNWLDVWYTRLDVDEIVGRWGAQAGRKELRSFRKATAKAEAKTGLRAMAKLTRIVDGRPQFVSDPPIVVRLEELVSAEEAARFTAQVGKLLRSYTSTLSDDRRVLLERFRFADIARKVVGVGSVGTRAWVVLMLGRDDGDPLLLQFKEARRSVLEPYLGASKYEHHGRRVVEGQTLMQASSDILLGWQRTAGLDGVPRDFYVRQLWDKKGSAVIEQMTARGMRVYATLCGWTLARAHARSGDPITIAAYLGSGEAFDRAMIDFAEAYADQNERDHAALRAAIRDGHIEATSNV